MARGRHAGPVQPDAEDLARYNKRPRLPRPVSGSILMFRHLSVYAFGLCFCVVVLGAFVRLSDAGLGCPDWPGCYGHVGVPETVGEVSAANAAFPERPVEAHKAWKEMVHRYAAGMLGLLILGMSITSVLEHRKRKLPHVLVGLVIFQAVLGMWTVTLLLKPLVVTSHLIGGMTILALLALVSLRERDWMAGWPVPTSNHMPHFSVAALVMVCLQIFLGAWTSTNYAALACADFPTCHGKLWPETDFAQGFTLWHGLGINYEFGVLDGPGRTAIHMAHRVGALLTAIVVGALIVRLLRETGASNRWRRLGVILLLALTLQIALGIASVVFHLPLPVATAHNAGAALLLLVIVAINWAVFNSRRIRQ